MASGTFPIITCDSEYGCDQWTLDWYTATASNWRAMTEPGWQFEPHQRDVPDLCPECAPIDAADKNAATPT